MGLLPVGLLSTTRQDGVGLPAGSDSHHVWHNTLHDVANDLGIPSLHTFSVAPGGSISVGANTVTLSPYPAGITAASVNKHYVYISGGTGTAEACLITARSATTITFTAANTHSGAFTIASATAGIQEAIQVVGPSLGRVHLDSDSKYCYAKIFVPYSVSIRGRGMRNSTIVMNTGYTGTALDVVTPSGSAVDIGDFTIFYITQGLSGAAVNVQDVVDGIIENLAIYSPFTAIKLYSVGRVFVTNINSFNVGAGGFVYEISSNPASGVITVSVPTIHGGFHTLGVGVGTVFRFGATIAGMIISDVQSVQGVYAVSCADDGAINEVTFNNCIFDSLSAGITNIQLTGASSMERWTFTDCMVSLVAGATQGFIIKHTTSGGIRGFQLRGGSLLCQNAGVTGLNIQGTFGTSIAGFRVHNQVAGGIAVQISGAVNLNCIISACFLGGGTSYGVTNNMTIGVLVDAQAHDDIVVDGHGIIADTPVVNNSTLGVGSVLHNGVAV